MHVLNKEMNQAFSAHVNTSCTKLEILDYIHDRGELSQPDLQASIGLDAAAITRHLQQLKQQELITTRKSEADKRITLLSLTKLGEAELKELWQRSEEFYQKMTDDFSDAEIQALTDFIERIARNVHQK
ncbi:MarR family transcriptional regulator [Bacillus sp. FJAT-27264]|uniref:MarR family winged helix-turn-helix transcriptional regulator n=1 Tax=Paenibacillus sp. (strain DSM 101736 / FJAT-27264) TaxID=1850362 RepID=UPI00257007F7|nr:MarR family transcriptional regulator [Bacillus sp. FJAT-27264]